MSKLLTQWPVILAYLGGKGSQDGFLNLTPEQFQGPPFYLRARVFLDFFLSLLVLRDPPSAPFGTFIPA